MKDGKWQKDGQLINGKEKNSKIIFNKNWTINKKGKLRRQNGGRKSLKTMNNRYRKKVKTRMDEKMGKNWRLIKEKSKRSKMEEKEKKTD